MSSYPETIKKLVLALATSSLMTVASIKTKFVLRPKLLTLTNNVSLLLKATEALPPLDYMPCIYYLLYIQKDSGNIKALIDFDNEINRMILAYAKKLGFYIQKINIRA